MPALLGPSLLPLVPLSKMLLPIEVAIQRRVLHILGNHSKSMGIILGMLTNDRLMEKVEELNLKLQTIMLAIPEAERIYLLEKGKAKKNEASEPNAHIVPA
ncbi:Urea-proton symporter DUR3 [Camellia lanceoleosa]|uniref:Urea-proton symporter DUR3 n=1 Tax=Camellia lanceoleosa TaxID=1840588 RepID=A0ACC0FTY7_9ERIC|nr:Urea-proton symporter DUR3 [Camellia lanceoleosa]